jgi:hypothetical protein
MKHCCVSWKRSQAADRHELTATAARWTVEHTGLNPFDRRAADAASLVVQLVGPSSASPMRPAARRSERGRAWEYQRCVVDGSRWRRSAVGHVVADPFPPHGLREATMHKRVVAAHPRRGGSVAQHGGVEAVEVVGAQLAQRHAADVRRPAELGFCCAPGRIRTCDTRFRKPLLSPLSYEGIVGRPGPPNGDRRGPTPARSYRPAARRPVRRCGRTGRCWRRCRS